MQKSTYTRKIMDIGITIKFSERPVGNDGKTFIASFRCREDIDEYPNITLCLIEGLGSTPEAAKERCLKRVPADLLKRAGLEPPAPHTAQTEES